MFTRFAAALGLALASPSIAQQAVPAPAAEDLVKVALDTEKGRIVIAVDRGRAPVTADNFLRYVAAGKYNGESFYRAMTFGSGGLVQAGVRSDARKLLPPIEHEPTSRTGLRHVAGSVSMARLAPGTARSDFFILTADTPAFDANPAAAGDNAGFAAFGSVVEGMDVVKAILASPVSPTKGAEVGMQGQLLDPVVKITKATQLP